MIVDEDFEWFLFVLFGYGDVGSLGLVFIFFPILTLRLLLLSRYFLNRLL